MKKPKLFLGLLLILSIFLLAGCPSDDGYDQRTVDGEDYTSEDDQTDDEEPSDDSDIDTEETTTTTTTTTTTLAEKIQSEADEYLLEKKYAYLIDLTTLTVENCDETENDLENRQERIKDDITDKEDDIVKKEVELAQLETELTDLKENSTATIEDIDFKKRKIRNVIDRLDEMTLDLDDLKIEQEDMNITIEKVEQECKRVKVRG